MGLREFFSNSAETRELHNDVELRSRYYKISYKKARIKVEDYCNLVGINIKDINDDHGEIYLQTAKYHMIVSIVQVTPLETAIDMKVETYQIIGRGIPKKKILELYKYLNDELSFKGVGLHP